MACGAEPLVAAAAAIASRDEAVTNGNATVSAPFGLQTLGQPRPCDQRQRRSLCPDWAGAASGSARPTRSKLSARRRLRALFVVGLRIGARLLHAAEIEPASACKRWGFDELQNGRAALLHGARRLDAAQANHGRVHVGRRMRQLTVMFCPASSLARSKVNRICASLLWRYARMPL